MSTVDTDKKKRKVVLEKYQLPGGIQHKGLQVCTKQRAFEKPFKFYIKIASFASKLFIFPLNSLIQNKDKCHFKHIY